MKKFNKYNILNMIGSGNKQKIFHSMKSVWNFESLAAEPAVPAILYKLYFIHLVVLYRNAPKPTIFLNPQEIDVNILLG